MITSATIVSKINERLLERANAISTLTDTDIVPRFSTNTLYNDTEQKTINKALKILAGKLVSQEAANQFTTSQAAKNFFQLKLATSEREIFAVMFLNAEHRLIAYEEMSVGTLDAAAVYPREIIKKALDHGAISIILAHNHPSGNTTPSQADTKITAIISHAAALFHIDVLDHIVVSVSGATSFKESGRFDDLNGIS